MIRRLILMLAACVLLATACGGGSDEAAAPTLAGYEREPDPSVGALSLPAVNRDNVDFSFRADPGELLMVYFAFTNCPDFCPTTLADTRIALNELGGFNIQNRTLCPAGSTSAASYSSGGCGL